MTFEYKFKFRRWANAEVAAVVWQTSTVACSVVGSVENEGDAHFFCHLCDHSPVQQEKGYSSLQDEAVKIFNSLQEIETVSDPIPIIQGILQTCHDLKPLRDEVYCQLIKQTNHMPHPNSTGNLHHWQLMACMSCTFLPSRGILRYLRFHLRR